jgi:hypothetical protein
MAKKIQLKIDEPCHENWDKMNKAEQGRFCGSCQKHVVDFTNMSDSQLAAFFKKPSSGSVCGRFYDDQLDRSIEIPRKRIPWVRYFVQFALPAFLITVRASAQSKPKPVKTDNIVSSPQPLMLGKVATYRGEVAAVEQLDIKGQVTDENGVPVPYATVKVKGTQLGTAADSSGVFKIKNFLFSKSVVLLASSVGYNVKEITISRLDELTKDIVIKLDKQMLNEVVVTAGLGIQHRSFMMGGIGVKRTSRDIEEIPLTKSPEEKKAMIKVYPNPVTSGTTINIGCEKLKEGYYMLQLVSLTGQQIQAKQIWIDEEATTINFTVPRVAAGSYLLVLVNTETGEKYSEKIIIQ